MPLTTLTIAGVGVFYTILKSLIDEALSEPFMAFYRAMGLTKSRLFLKALRYALPMYIIAVLYRMGLIIAGAVATETIFNYPGMGKLLIDAFASRDYPVLLGWAVIISLTLAALNIAGDVMQDILDPRVRELV
jgi:ABC-type dipeptide/oligopeptide/nickel transport system permease component